MEDFLKLRNSPPKKTGMCFLSIRYLRLESSLLSQVGIVDKKDTKRCLIQEVEKLG